MQNTRHKDLETISWETGLTLHEQVRRHLREMVMRCSDGERFYSERELIVRLRVSQPTVRHALAELAAEGLLDRGVGRGTFVRKSIDRSVGVFFPKLDSFLQLSLVGTLCNLCAEQDLGFHLYHLRPNRSMKEMCESLKRSPRSERIIFSVTMSDDSMELYHELEGHGFRSVYHGSLVGYPGSSVAADHEAGAKLALARLVALGHRRIVFIINEPATLQSIQTRVAALRRQVEKDAMKEVTFLDCNLPPWGDSFAAAYGKMEEALSVSPRPTAICPISGNGTWAALRYLSKHGVKVPEDVSLFSFDDTPACQQIYPSITALSSSPETERVCLKILWSDKPHVQKEKIAPCLIARESTGPARSS